MISRWEHWCHCHEMYLQLIVGEKCLSCGRYEPDILDEEHYFKDDLDFTSNLKDDNVKPQT